MNTTYISDAAAAHVCAAHALRAKPELSRRSYFISGGEPQRLAFFLNALLRACGRQPITKTIPPKLGLGLGAFCEAVWRALGITQEPPLTRFVAAQLATAHWYNIDRARQELGYQPRVSLTQGCALLHQAQQS